MDNNAALGFLVLIKELVKDKVKYAEIQEEDGENTLYCAVDSPVEEGKDVVYQFSLNSVPGGGVICEMIIFAFNDVESKYFDDINRLVNKLNNYLVIGSFRLFEESNSVMYVQGAVLDENLDAAVATGVLGDTLVMMENAVVNCGEYFTRLFDGEDIDALLESIDKEDKS